ncbi:hypothetical protein A3A46_04540 [Candidatus Roizmanbacteria bacterium RIFCSPLOWO2_01_FULL_37_13]|uniref:AAA+ ATPase domain-containing protein n=1 Tax=Candidatus Roizmanbacteria bacterium RIFCSPHIGHO2_02_FULL_38_11 TaxID=1802039 RepID=A0A1F7H3G6_9BACT|nr:MAG: hypothetical protein A3C25_02505 [Candidatus Roizmanbacteria bacterium RIFCSPHIGHO2_02_FULL_38_11]OGK33975.1 MAG: hypothetical protein A3F58_03070 [Candidatus Roizmanbacteria bacterium RIFCSPHIGHO2_12_FULL_37_9b]OGK42992.1 MAG: hypothetical protein A3A46_04540 [Candidatus Roizmanbacteria bacterium RIFCSPLOWO2_01_FULL_37_13]
MIIYQGSSEEFNQDVIQNQIADKIAKNFEEAFHRINESEYRSWATSLAILNNSFIYAGLKDNYLLVEYQLPYSSKRIDVLVFGKNSSGEENVVILELKQWSNKEVKLSDAEGNIIVDYGRFIKEQPHPSLQVQGYYFYLKDFFELFNEVNGPKLNGASYLHNYSKLKNAELLSTNFAKEIKSFPIFSKEDSSGLADYLRNRLQQGNGKVVFQRFSGSTIRPSKKLLDHTSEMINHRQIFNLIDDQIVAYNNILKKVKEIEKSNKKAAVIIKGGPGTGKSVIALEIMGELLRKGEKVMHATGSSAFTNTLRKVVGVRARNLFKFFNSFMSLPEDYIDVLICDEAHRIRETSENRYTPRSLRTNLPQIDELFKVAKLNIFLIDEFQIVRPNEIGSVSLIKEAAKRIGIKESEIPVFELKSQFRCSGSDAYLQWLDDVLGIRESELARFDAKMEFRIFDNPTDMMNEIRKKNKEIPNSARITAGFCWPWSPPRSDGTLVNDVKIGDFEMPWEKKDQFWKWATDNSGMEQVGTVYTSQGFEFDYIAVIFGNDLVYDPVKKDWLTKLENSYDTYIKRKNPDITKHLKSVYRVLMSRAHKGVLVYFMDKETEKFFKSKMESI